ncbi:hypothetical protein ACQCVK_04120 [Rossellomorea vietnamensis]|uniref:hypothetical protein n=1 Tax=Rossellomorea vietnamensis TaxID=218284 RepID=UPI003CEF0751
MSHTPSPWRVGRAGVVVSDHPIDTGGRSTGHNDAIYYGGHLIAESIHRGEDAALISAAPELLEACQKAYEVLEAISSHCGNNLQVYGWHLNGDPETFDSFIDDNMDGNELDLLFKTISKAKGEKINE